jgi:glucose-6-phosphate isomerase, archaeal
MLARRMNPFGNTLSEGMSRIDWPTGKMHGESVQSYVRKLGQLDGVFRDHNSWRSIDPETVIYSVQWQEPVPQDTEAGLHWGSTTIEPGLVGDEYFMTRGHFHARRNRGEFYCAVQGHGMLILMGEDRSARVESMSPGSLHYIPGHTAHRTVNTGEIPFIFWACWPSDAGHDYATIAEQSFSARVLHRNGAPEVVYESLKATSL